MDSQRPQQMSDQGIRRKPLPRRPVPVQAAMAVRTDAMVPQPGPNTTEKPLPLAPDAKTEPELGLQQKLDELRLGDREPEPPSPMQSQFLAQRRQQMTSTTLGSTASSTPTWATTASTVSTSATSVMSSESLSAPPLPERPRTATPTSMSMSAGQYGPGFDQVAATGPAADGPAAVDESEGKGKEPSFWKTALDETRFFAGGLMPKPAESTKHYTIMRHSSGLIMYHGPATSVAVTVFSSADHPLPGDRTVWLQRRGFSGDAGLRLKTLVGASGSWLDVTPERQAAAGEVPAADERGYERDIAKLLKRAAKHGDKALARRRPRETLVVRIPAAAQDGYFRLVLCSGGTTSSSGGPTTKRKVLCGCPVFRVASTSTDSSIFRGASLRTLPLEAGVKIASVIGSSTVTTWTEPIVTAVQDKVQAYQPGMVGTMAATEAYDRTGLQQRLDQAGQTYDESRETAYSAYGGDGGGDDDAPPDVVGADTGPEKPFPLTFQGRVVRGTGRSSRELGVPTANLEGVPDDVRLRMRGLYFGWAAVQPQSEKKEDEGDRKNDPRVSLDWIEVLVAVSPSPWAPAAAVVPRNDVAVHLLYDFGGASLLERRLRVVVMGFLRPLGKGTAGGMSGTNQDARVAVSSLSRPRWGPQATLTALETDKSARGMTDRLADSRGRLQKQVDRLPAHWVGVRTSGGEMRDQLYGNGGFFVVRG